MDRGLGARIVLWRLRRGLLRRTMGVLLIGLSGLLAVGLAAQWLAGVPRGIRSPCLPYELQLPTSWQVRAVSLAQCGKPVLDDEYRAVVDRVPVTIAVQGVSINGAGPRVGTDLSFYDSSVRHSRSGQSYVVLVEGLISQPAIHATFVRSGYSYIVTVQAPDGGVLATALTETMDGWYATSGPAGPPVVEASRHASCVWGVSGALEEAAPEGCGSAGLTAALHREEAPVVVFIVGWIIIGIIAGWLAGLVVGGSGFGVLGDMVVGLIGAVIGGWVLSLLLGAGHGANNGGFLWSLVVSFIGAVILLLIVRLVSGGTRRSMV